MSAWDMFCWALGISCSMGIVSLAGLLTVGCVRIAKDWIEEIME